MPELALAVAGVVGSGGAELEGGGGGVHATWWFVSLDAYIFTVCYRSSKDRDLETRGLRALSPSECRDCIIYTRSQ